MVQMFSQATLRELDASAYEEAPPLSAEEIAEELGRTSEGGARPGSSNRSLGGRRRSLGRRSSQVLRLCLVRFADCTWLFVQLAAFRRLREPLMRCCSSSLGAACNLFQAHQIYLQTTGLQGFTPCLTCDDQAQVDLPTDD